MSQLESLFEEVGEAAWRFAIEIKCGGGPFDPAGFAIKIVNPRGALVAYEVAGRESSEWPMRQIFELFDEIHQHLAVLLVDEILDEVHRQFP